VHTEQPFGGVGESGRGQYYGEAGFLRMTQEKAMFVQPRRAPSWLFYPPYGKRFDWAMGWLRKLI
jgi:coniferyl-aldehyde dehydrogenase